MTIISTYLQTWRLQLCQTKTVTTAFHLNNREAKRELNIYNNGKRLPFCPVPTYLGVKLDRSLTFRHHLEALRKKLTTRVALMRQLADSDWGAGAKTLRTAALSLVYSTAEYCAPVWCRSAHTRLIDSVLNDALRIVTGCLRPTPTDYLPVLAGIQPADLRRLGAMLSLAYRGSMIWTYLLLSIAPLSDAPPLTFPLLLPLLPFLTPGRCFRTWVLITYQVFYLSLFLRCFAQRASPFLQFLESSLG